MKVYVIRDKQTQQYQTVVMDFIPDIRQSDIFIDYEVALAYCPSDCEVVECELIEKTELADHDKQVRKEVVQEIWEKFEQRFMNKTKDMPVINVANLINSVLDQISTTEKI